MAEQDRLCLEGGRKDSDNEKSFMQQKELWAIHAIMCEIKGRSRNEINLTIN